MLIAVLALVLGLILRVFWQPIVSWFSPAIGQKQKITLAVTKYPGSGLLYLALEKGYFAREGFDVSLQPHSSGRDALSATQSGQADLGTVADLPIVYESMKGQQVSVVATIFNARQSYGVIARRDRLIHRFSDLKGKKIGVTLRTDGHYVFSTMLARHHISLDQVQIENVVPEKMMDALLRGEVDAVSTWEPWLKDFSRALDKNGIEFRTIGDFVLNYNLAGRSEWIANNQNIVQGLLRAIIKAKDDVDENPQEAFTLIARLMNIERSVFDTVGPNYRYVVHLDQNLLFMMKDQARWAIENKFSDAAMTPDFLKSIDARALIAVHPDAVKLVK
ncbi:NrtA/SsuA/CpmA family ABC transporter substrate-binding protein [Undibacterium sp. LX15W]|uniref:NrtA/SsuA/CpmA family ABC transporter substrate-binding protein n=2 Tax=Undibacterium flavidum TaxID=2762297 RepID=A0ABR6YFR0_9BURK|nr:NrtA/SsuA/CpmA family ABC transporter substrate-binding protein [Undibacterium flavidum]